MEGNSVVADNVLPYYSKRFESQLVGRIIHNKHPLEVIGRCGEDEKTE